MQVQVPDLTAEQFGQAVTQLVSVASIPASVANAMQVLAVQHIAAGLASGALTIIPKGGQDAGPG